MRNGIYPNTASRYPEESGLRTPSWSLVLLVRPPQPPPDLEVHLLRGGDANLHPHRLMDLRRLQPPARLPSHEAKAQVDPVLRRRLHPGERPSRGDERDVRLPRLD